MTGGCAAPRGGRIHFSGFGKEPDHGMRNAVLCRAPQRPAAVAAHQGPGGQVMCRQPVSAAYRPPRCDIPADRPSAPASPYFAGPIDRTAVHPAVLGPAQIVNHHALGTAG